MKRTLFIMAALLLILVSSLAACSSSASEETAPSSTGTGDPVAGEKIYVRVCMTCHGPKGEGVSGLSGDLTQSELIASQTDQGLVEFIKSGGAPGEPLVMLPKGGNPALTQKNLYDLVAYVRSLRQ